MRIAYVTETYPPEVNGVSLTAARAVAHLRVRGHAVQLIRPRQRGEVAHHSAGEWRTAGGPIPLYRDLQFGWLSAELLKTTVNNVGIEGKTPTCFIHDIDYIFACLIKRHLPHTKHRFLLKKWLPGQGYRRLRFPGC